MKALSVSLRPANTDCGSPPGQFLAPSHAAGGSAASGIFPHATQRGVGSVGVVFASAAAAPRDRVVPFEPCEMYATSSASTPISRMTPFTMSTSGSGRPGTFRRRYHLPERAATPTVHRGRVNHNSNNALQLQERYTHARSHHGKERETKQRFVLIP
jgi:hypothetical protein